MMPVMEALPIRQDRHEVVVGGEDVFVPRPAAEPVADRVDAPRGVQQADVGDRRVEVAGEQAARQEQAVRDG